MRSILTLLTLCAVLALAGCGRSSAGPASAPAQNSAPSAPSAPPAPPRPPVIRPKDYFYFTAKTGDLEEVRDHITAVWATCWGDPPGSVAQLQAAQMPAIQEYWSLLFAPNQLYLGDAVASANLRQLFDTYGAAGVLGFISKLYVDEPQAYSVGQIQQATGITRSVLAQYSELAATRLMVCFGDKGGGAQDFYSLMPYFDDIAGDAYDLRATIVDPGGWWDNVAAQLLPGQLFYPVPGVNTGVGALTPDEFNQVITYALGHPLCGGVMPFTWFDRIEEDGSYGARSTALRQPCIDAGMLFKQFNLQAAAGAQA